MSSSTSSSAPPAPSGTSQSSARETTVTTAGGTAASSSSPAGGPPRRCIYNDADLRHFLASPAKRELVQVTAAMGRACAASTAVAGEGDDVEEAYQYDPSHPLVGLSPALASLHGSLRGMYEEWLLPGSGCEPFQDRSQMRFGNPAFRNWHQRLVQYSPAIVKCLLKCHNQQEGDKGERDPHREYPEAMLQEAAEKGRLAATIATAAAEEERTVPASSVDDIVGADVVEEVCAYLNAAFGHPVRLDYGTGHECSFQVALLALLKLGCFGSTSELPPTRRRLHAATISLYQAYLQVTRQLQTEYMLEPAGSHGVWGLDDYHCLPFYFGACQLQGQDEYLPSSIHNDSVLRTQGDAYLYMGCIRYIKALKKNAPFYETSPMLNDISQLPKWDKVSSGLLRLFEGEVLNKRQVVQHFVFGKLFAANWTPSESDPCPTPPTQPFRTGGTVTTATAAPIGPMARAPWATAATTTTPHAPWTRSAFPPDPATADDDYDYDDGLMAPPTTRAPWAR